jgi:murein L,D-transpeptidase YafK
MLIHNILKYILRITLAILVILIFVFVGWQAIQIIAIRQKAQLFAPYAYQNFSTAFQRAGVHYPPKQLAFLVFKNNKRLEIYARDNNQWKYIKTLPILAASGHAGPKLHEGDRQVPEGIYQITELNPFSDYTLSMKINYPNEFDQIHARFDHRTELGSEIYIHGSDLSIGCMAMGDKGIEQLFPLVYEVGIKHVVVIIAPNDLRIQKPIQYPNSPRWTSELYHKIKNKLLNFPA